MITIMTARLQAASKSLLSAFLSDESGQSSVETMLVISVITIAVVGAGYLFAGGDSGFIQAMKDFAKGAETVYSTGPE